jgi:hypothetical protein
MFTEMCDVNRDFKSWELGSSATPCYFRDIRRYAGAG